ncbi:hypothetical protein BE11_12235 [Sorangium cellulosum]|nr:hypothetical protein BE11_12235 [Sorangium cellulosum]
MVGDLHVAARGHDIDDTVLEGDDRGDGADRQLAAAAQYLAEVTRSLWVEVLGDHDGRREGGA